jgi:tetratricopeptide (TPR) repeat protein
VAGFALAAVGLVLVWVFSGEPRGKSPTEDILSELKRLEAREGGEQAPEVFAVHQEALGVARQLLERYPADPHAVDVVAWTYLRLSRLDEARQCWQRCVEMDPGFGDGYFWLGRLARDVGEEERAVEHFRQAIAHGATNQAAPVLLARSLENLGRFPEALAILEAENKSKPNNPGVLVLLGQVYLKVKDYKKAKAVFERARALDPEVPGASFGLATAYARLGDQAKAKQAAVDVDKERARNVEQEKRLSAKPADSAKAAREDLALVYTAAGKVYFAQGDARQAEDCWRRAAETAPYALDSWLMLAWAFEQQGRKEDALGVLADLTKAFPESPDVYLRFGERAAAFQRFEVAERAFRDAIRVAPRIATGYAALAHYYLRTGRNVAEATSLARQAVDFEPRAPNYSLLASAFLASGDRASALVAIDRAVAIDPGNADFRRFRESILHGP